MPRVVRTVGEAHPFLTRVLTPKSRTDPPPSWSAPPLRSVPNQLQGSTTPPLHTHTHTHTHACIQSLAYRGKNPESGGGAPSPTLPLSRLLSLLGDCPREEYRLKGFVLYCFYFVRESRCRDALLGVRDTSINVIGRFGDIPRAMFQP
ncbi:hypothetical protein HJG60_008334 [Phyllostomus discolor]|uniref:Uncharacterized protein n=1 Tax=Phyllostomus discolor TaxID=89673 RepID=A0A834DQ95_9CHIR|nr:hypothetical protein HJG60_008334 [Phyllostomus discolor]